MVSYLKVQKYKYEIIVVVNGSSDKTLLIVKELSHELPGIITVNLEQGGKGNAVKHGILEKATGDIVLFMDADNATPISEIEKFLPEFKKGADVVIGSRYLNPELVKVSQPFYRVALSRMSNLLIQIMAVSGIKDTQLGFKAFTKHSAKDIFNFVTITKWGFDMEVLTIARMRGHEIKEIGVQWTEYGGGHIKSNAYYESLLDLFRISFMKLKGDYTREYAENN